MQIEFAAVTALGHRGSLGSRFPAPYCHFHGCEAPHGSRFKPSQNLIDQQVRQKEAKHNTNLPHSRR